MRIAVAVGLCLILMTGSVLAMDAKSKAATESLNAGMSGNPYTMWTMGPPKDPSFFPIAVWLQSPKNAGRYKKAGMNIYIGLWKGPTEAQLAELKKHDMKVICSQNEVGLKHKDDPAIIAWMHGDEPDNAHKFKTFWKGDFEKVKEAWPQIEKFKSMKQYKGYGPPVPPAWIIRDYKAMKAKDPSRPIIINLGQGVAWEKFIGRGERSGKLEDYPEYIKGCDMVSFDIYPACHGKPDVKGNLWYVPKGVDRLREWSKDKKVVWDCIECTCISNPGNCATPKEVKAEVWMSLIHGSMGLIYFVHQFKPKFVEAGLLANPEMTGAVTAINQQIHELAPVLNSPSHADLATVTPANADVPIAIMNKKVDGATYVFAVAMRKGETEATFNLQAAPEGGTVTVLGENRTVPLAGKTFKDSFKAWDVHLYKIVK